MDDHSEDKTSKQCRKCGQVKPLEDFHRDKSALDRHVPCCKACVAIRQGVKHHRTRKVSPDGMRWCAECHQMLPIESFYKKPTKIGYSYVCKTCHSLKGGHKPFKRFNVPEGMKRCHRCNSVLPVSSFHINQGAHDGMCNFCKDCIRDKNGSVALYKPPKGMKHCPGCGTDYPATDEFFYKSRSRKGGLNFYCKSCNNKRSIEWNKKHPKFAQKNYSRYKVRHADRIRASELRRRAREQELPNSFNENDYSIMMAYWSDRCAFCGNPAGLFRFNQITVDHWIPVTDKRSDNPGTVPTNMLPACLSCNSSKRDRDAHVWLIDKFGKRNAKAIEARITIYFEWLIKK